MDPGWLGILKASAWQLLALSIALFGFWLLLQYEVLPPTNSLWVIYGLPLAMLITGGLAVTSFLEKLVSWSRKFFRRRHDQRQRAEKIAQHQKQFTDHLKYLSENERAIYGWLLSNNQKSFTAEMDCGHGASLFKRGFIQSDAIGGIGYGMNEFPFSVPDHIWEVLEENRDNFPNEFKGRKLPWFRRGW